MRKRFISLLVALCMMASLLPAGAVSALAETAGAVIVNPDDPDGKYTYTLYDNGTAALTKYEGTDAVVPAQVEYKNALYQVTKVGDAAFALEGGSLFYQPENIKLQSVMLPDSIQEIGKKAFLKCVALESIVFPNGLTATGRYAFSNCTNLQKIEFSGSITTISEGSFANCTSLTEIKIPDTVISIESYAFTQCTGLTNVVLPKHLTSVSQGTFKNCTELKSITIPSDVILIHGGFESAFKGCSGLETIYYNGSNPDIFNDCGLDLSKVEIKTGPNLTVTGGTFTVAGGKAQTNGDVPVGAVVTVTADKENPLWADSGLTFGYWEIAPSLKDENDDPVDNRLKNFTFVMPEEAVTMTAMPQEASVAEEDSSSILGTAAIVGTVAVSGAILAWQGYQLGTEAYLNYLLPEGAAIPTNRAELALLLWNDAGRPVPAALLNADALEAEQAIAWAVEHQLMDAGKAPDASVSRVEVIRTWKKAQGLKTSQ